MAQNILLNPVVAFIVFLAIGCGIYFLAGKMTAGEDVHHSRRQTYTGGEEVAPPEGQVRYHAFFWMALLFGILHMAALGDFYPAAGKHAISFGFVISIGCRRGCFCAQ